MSQALLDPPILLVPPAEPPAPPLEDVVPFPGLDPEGLFSWLHSFPDSATIVGESHGAVNCPLAHFARHRLGLEDPAVSSFHLTYALPTPTPDVALDVAFLRARASVPLPPWARAFVHLVDHSGCGEISVRLAKRLLLQAGLECLRPRSPSTPS